MSTYTAEQDKELADKLLTEIESIVKKYLPFDMDMATILSHTDVMTSLIGVTRSRVMAGAVYFSLYAQIVGLDGEDVKKTVNEILAAVKADPRTAELAADYAVKNAQAKQQAAVTAAKMADGGVSGLGAAFMVPGDKTKVH